jgi:hypothetical protein
MSNVGKCKLCGNEGPLRSRISSLGPSTWICGLIQTQ